MFSILISEKGGSERREHYDRAELTIGRVQGNDLVLAKGNVSKRHARLLYREDQFIVNDLKSTNGTYVNGRKITQATIVREGDKVYIGDFVLRVEATLATSAQASPRGVPTTPRLSDDGSTPHPPASPSRSPALGSLPPAPRASAPRITSMPGPRDFISHFPLERDPDELEPAYVPGPPKVPTGARMTPHGGGAESLVPDFAAPPRATSPSPGSSHSPPQVAPAERVALADPAAHARRQALLGALVARAAASLGDPIPIQASAELTRRVGELLSIQAGVMMAAGEIPASIPIDGLVADAARELLGTGPLELLLADEEVLEIHVAGHDHVMATEARRQLVSEVVYTSEAALVRALDRLCRSAGRAIAEDEVYVERRLGSGARLFAILPTVPGQGAMAVLRKPQRADLSLDDLTRAGTISRAIGGLLRLGVMARANMLVTGSIGAGTTSLLSALAAAGRTDDRVIVLQDDDELILTQPHTVSILLESASEARVRAVRAATRMHPDRLVVGAFAGVVAAEIIDAIGDGVDGVLAAAHASTIRQAMLRLTADLAATRAALSPDVAREWLASAFDLAIEVARLPNGQHRVMRVAELGVENGAVVARDIFTFTAEHAGPGAFDATGLVPRIVEDLRAKGVAVDASLFKR